MKKLDHFSVIFVCIEGLNGKLVKRLRQGY